MNLRKGSCAWCILVVSKLRETGPQVNIYFSPPLCPKYISKLMRLVIFIFFFIHWNLVSHKAYDWDFSRQIIEMATKKNVQQLCIIYSINHIIKQILLFYINTMISLHSGQLFYGIWSLITTSIKFTRSRKKGKPCIFIPSGVFNQIDSIDIWMWWWNGVIFNQVVYVHFMEQKET